MRLDKTFEGSLSKAANRVEVGRGYGVRTGIGV